jgi:hypothetical protein
MPEALVLHKVQGSSRNDGSDRGDFWSVKNPNLSFYAFHVTRNRLLNIYLHAHGRDRMIAIVCFPVMLLRRAIPFLLGKRFDAVGAMFKGIGDFWRNRSVTPAPRSDTWTA